MSSPTLIKSAGRFWPVKCLMVIAFGIAASPLLAQNPLPLSCREVAILGAVKNQGRFEIAARMHLGEVLAKVGGPSEYAGNVIKVTHDCQCSPCAEGEMKAATISEYNLSAVLEGRAEANPLVGAGDRIIVSEAEMVFVLGKDFSKRLVYRAGLTLTQAIATVGDGAGYSDLSTVRIQRNPVVGARPKSISLTLKLVLENRHEDPLLEPQDIIEISDEAGNFRSRLPRPIFLDSPLTHPSEKPLLATRGSSNS